MKWPHPQLAVIVLTALAGRPLLADLAPESGAFLFQTYSAKTYSASPQNFAALEDSRGVMYFGNTDGVLEFDGTFWRLIPLSNKTPATALAMDARGRIFVGGNGVFGYLAPDQNGVTQFVPLKVPKQNATLGEVWDIVPTSEGVFFRTYKGLFLLTNGGAIKVWRPTERFRSAFTAYGELFVSTSDRGLLQLRGDEFIPGPKGETEEVRGSVILSPGEPPLLAGRHKIFRFSPSALEPFPTEADDYLKEHEIYSLHRSKDGEIAIGTRSGGLVLLKADGGLERIVDKGSGLPGNWIAQIYRDSRSAIWLATDNGLARFETGLTSFGEKQGIEGSVTSVSRLNGVIYAGTSSGLFRMRLQPGQEAAFDPVAEVPLKGVWDLQARGGESFAAVQSGLFSLTGNRARQILESQVIYGIGFSARDRAVLYTAGRDGIHMLRQSGKNWNVIAHETGKGQDFRTVAEDSDGRVWATTAVAIWRMDFSTTPATVEEFDARSGVPQKWKNAYPFQGHIVFATEKGLLKFSEKDRRFVPDAELGEQFADGGKGVSIVREDALNNIWVTGKGYHGVLRRAPGGSYAWYDSPLLESGIDEMWSIFVDDDGTSWASGADGALFRREAPVFKPGSDDVQVLLRKVTVSGGETLFGGDGAVAEMPPLPHRDNALRFEFSSPFYEDPSAVQYQFWLEGNEKTWSQWTSEPRKDYTNLFEHPYKFHVRARSPHGAVSQEAAFAFRILPPFYRTWWAYLFYVGSFLLAGWIILRWRLNALEAKNRWLEGVVEQRTAEVRSERDQNEALLLNILPKPVASELRQNGEVKPTTFDDVTVCFSDFVGFTLSSEKMAAGKLIDSLNEYFTVFDEIIGRYGLEKLKTIGDAYMFAGGLPDERPSHAVDSVLAALEMVAAVNRLARPEEGVNWRIRLGLYSGPVVAGVVGKRKFAFDIWGNTVNFAARMESAGLPGRVNLSGTTFERISQFVDCEARGPVAIKEGRRMEMYFVVAPKAELLHGPLVDGIPSAFREAYEKAFGEPPRAFPDAAILGDMHNQAMAARDSK